MGLGHSPKIVTGSLALSFDAANFKSFRGEPVTNLIPTPLINSYPTTGNGWGTYNTNQYGSGNYFSIGTVSSVSSNIVTMSAAHSLRSYDVMQPQTTGGGVTAGTNYLVKKLSSTTFSLHPYNSSQDGSQGYINSATGTHKVYDDFANDVRISINSTNFPTMWWGYPHLPNSALVKELRYKEFTALSDIQGATDCIRLHYIRTDDVKDGMSYGVDCTVTPSSPVTISFYTRAATASAVGKVIQYYIYNYIGGDPTAFAWNFTLGPVGVWQRQTFTYTPVNSVMISYWFPQSGGVYSWDWSCMQVEQKSYATPFFPGTRGTTVATNGGLKNLSSGSNHGELVNGPTYDANNRGSIVFDGTNDYIVTASPGSYSEYTVMFFCRWITDTVNGSRLFGLDNFGTYTIFNPSNVGFHYNPAGGSPPSVTLSSGVNIGLNSWCQIAVTVSAESTLVSIYINGVLRNTSSTLPSQNFAGNFYLGAQNTGTTVVANCNIGNFQLYSRALTAAEILQNFNALRGRYGI